MTTSTLESALSLSVAITDPENVSHSVRKTFVEPLSVEDQYFIKWLSERYESRTGTPIMTFACDGVVTLVCPTDLQRKRVENESKHSSKELIHQGSENNDSD